MCPRLLEGGVAVILNLYVDNILLLGKYRNVLGWIKQKLTNLFSMTDIEDADGGHHPEQLHQVLVGAVRYDKLQSCVYFWCGSRIFARPAGGDAFEQEIQVAFSGLHGLCNVPREMNRYSIPLTLSTSWRKRCPNSPRRTWQQPRTYPATWPG